jgi:hypothetical protein
VRQGEFFERAAADLSATDFRMAEYRVYEIGDGDHIVNATPIVCGNDHEAIVKARGLAGAHVVEVWNKERFVARLDPED